MELDVDIDSLDIPTHEPFDLTVLTPDQQVQAGLFCGGVFATLSAPLTSCAPSQYGSPRINIPAPGTEDDDKNPPRIKGRSLFDIAVGDDNLLRGDKYKWSLRFTVLNCSTDVIPNCPECLGSHTHVKPLYQLHAAAKEFFITDPVLRPANESAIQAQTLKAAEFLVFQVCIMDDLCNSAYAATPN